MILIVQVVIVFYLSVNHVPTEIFDETNTLRIASQNSTKDIVDVINLEQNFPLYYIVLHKLLQVTNYSLLPIQLIHFGAWVVSAVLFLFLLLSLGDKWKPSMSTFLFVVIYLLSSSIGLYAFVLRMYIFILVIFLWYLIMHILLFKCSFKSNKQLYISLAPLMLLMFLHPSGFIVFLTHIGTMLVFYRRILFRGFYPYALIATGTVSLWNVFSKTRSLYEIYIGGTGYLSGYKNDFHEFFSLLILNYISGLSLFMFIVFLYLSFRFVKTLFTKKRASGSLFLTPYLTMFLLLTLVLPTFNNSRHVIFLAPVLIAIMYIGYKHLSASLKLVMGTAIVLWFAQGTYYLASTHVKERLYIDVCNSMPKATKEDVVVTEFYTYNFISKCLGNAPSYVMLDSEGGYKLPENYKQILLYQASVGGQFGFGGHRSSFVKTIEGKKESIKATMRQTVQNNQQHQIFYAPYFQINEGSYIYQEELSLFEGYTHVMEFYPGIFVFQWP